jgi:hypothetical protein
MESLEDRSVPAVLPVTSTGLVPTQMGTLPYAVAHAHNGDTIAIQTSKPITLSQGELYLNHDVTIEGMTRQWAIISGHQARVFEVAPGAHVTLISLELTGGTGVSANPHGARNLDGYGGAVLNEGSLTVIDCLLSGNRATYGGAIENWAGTLAISGSELTGNVAKYDGGALCTNAGTVTLSSDKLMNNSALYGGAVYDLWGTVTMTSTLMSQNSASVAGGIYDYHGTVTVMICSVTKNSDDGIDNVGGTLRIGRSAFTGNTPHSVIGPYVNLGGNSGI